MIFVKNIPLQRAEFDNTTNQLTYVEKPHDLAIKFYHSIKGNERLKGRFTRCELICIPSGEILTRENGEVLASGETRVFSGNFRTKADQFDRRIGRKESLSRALAKTDLTKEDKAQVWTQYIKECKLP